MKIDKISINLYEGESDNDCEILLGFDSVDDTYSNIKLSDDVKIRY